MKKPPLIIVGVVGFDASILAQTTLKHTVEIVAISDVLNEIDTLRHNHRNNIKIPIFNSLNKDFKVDINDYPRSKFIDKPKRNYRRR